MNSSFFFLRVLRVKLFSRPPPSMLTPARFMPHTPLARGPFVRWTVLQLLLLSCILVVMAMPSSTLRAGVPLSADPNPVEALARIPGVAKALDVIDRSLGWIADQQTQLTEIPAPTFQEEKRAAAVRKILAAN